MDMKQEGEVMLQNVQLVENNADPEEVLNVLLRYIRQIHIVKIGQTYEILTLKIVKCAMPSLYERKYLRHWLG